jgi:predicted ATPase
LAVTSAAPVFVTELSLRRDPRGSPEAYPYSLPAIRQLETLRFPTPVTFLVGENGSGKSTLLEGIAGAFSHGEAFLALVLHRLRGNGFYLFDEPEAPFLPIASSRSSRRWHSW